MTSAEWAAWIAEKNSKGIRRPYIFKTWTGRLTYDEDQMAAFPGGALRVAGTPGGSACRGRSCRRRRRAPGDRGSRPPAWRGLKTPQRNRGPVPAPGRYPAIALVVKQPSLRH
eukprot:jgi/Botrbrau1/4357/Bobra.105_2s0006.1